jgi:hypothetical protein
MSSFSKLFQALSFAFIIFTLAACQPADKLIEKDLENADYPLPEVIKPVAAPVAEPVMETADEVLKERTIRDTRQKGKKGGYRATLFPKSESKEDEGTAFKVSW